MAELIAVFQITLAFLFVSNSCAHQCGCLKNGDHATCTNGLSTKIKQQYYTARMDSSNRLLSNAIPFTQMKSLYVHCDIESIEMESFKNQEGLEILDLSQNSLYSFPNNFFLFTPKLRTLDLTGNQFKKLSMDTFSNLKSLKLLSLSHNRLERVNVGILDEMEVLEELYLNHNNMAVLPLGLFDELARLKILDLSNNKLTRIETHLFEYTKMLGDLNIAGNDFEDENALNGLSGLSSVVNLNLSNSNIKSPKVDVFNKLNNLEVIDLSFNSLTLWSNMFDTLKNLTKVYMSHSDITSVPVHLFDNNRKLEELDLSYNHLTTLPNSLVNKSLEFKYLNISHNFFKDLPLEIFQWTDLTEIDLSYNKFTTIKPELLNMENMERIHAQHNKITYFEDMAFSSCTFPIRYIDLRYNRLVYLQEYFFDWLANLEELRIFGNPWDCTCLQELIDLLGKRFIQYDEEEYRTNSAICVAVDLKTCPYYTNNLTYYYDVFKNV